MTFFERIHINGFRRLADVDLELKPLNVVIGANGSGKTSLLDVFSLLAASASGRLKTTLSELGGIGEGCEDTHYIGYRIHDAKARSTVLDGDL